MSVTAASGTGWLNGFDPGSPASLTSSLGNLLGSNPADPANSSTPPGFGVLRPVPVAAPAGPSTYAKALSALTATADTFLIQSALNGYQPLAATAAFGSSQAYYQTLNSTVQTILQAGQSGNYGSINALA